ncbi:MAG: serine/threonine-protein phosphatase [Burkholderiales bacterium]|jgi:serine/threonine protein phosphatase PrpC|nr:serine/threonine-protein phosphatase [Burkholderiales bacterium]
MRFTIFQDSRKGSRKVNQDRIAYIYGRDTLLMVLADGMGGHAGGEIAAQIAVRLFAERFQQDAQPVLNNPLEFLHDTMRRAHAALGSYARQFSLVETPRTTCVAVIIQAGYAYWAHAGDSRFYLFRQGQVYSQTKDHSKVQYLLDRGLITEEEVPFHPERNRIYSCLGGAVEPVIDLSRRTTLRTNDILLLCSDGFWTVMPTREIANILTTAPLLQAAPRMMREAQQRGGADGDNLSTIIMRWDTDTDTDTPPATETATLSPDEFRTELERTVTVTDHTGVNNRELTDEEIERAIAEIQATIQKFRH